MDPFIVKALLMLADYLGKSDSLVDKVNTTIEHLLKNFDTDKSGDLSLAELKAALEKLKDQNAADAVNLRCVIFFVFVSLTKWDRDPEGTDKCMSKTKPMIASWSKDPRRAKLEKIVCTYYSSNRGKKIKGMVDELAKEYKGEIREMLIETIGPDVKMLISEIFCDVVPEPGALSAITAILF